MGNFGQTGILTDQQISHLAAYLQLPPPDAVRLEEFINYFSYDYPQPADEHPFSINVELSQAPWSPDHQLVHIGLQGLDVPKDELPDSNLVFLLDVSGSMRPANKLPLLKQAMKLLVVEACFTAATDSEAALAHRSAALRKVLAGAIPL